MNLDDLKTKTYIMSSLSQSRQRGSTVLLVLAMLSILLLLGIAFSYSTRLESQASYNYAELAQARTAASSGLPMALPMLIQASQGLTTTMQNWNTIPQALQKMVKANGKTPELTARDLAALSQAGLHVRQSKDGELESAPQASVQVRDLSGLINLNAVDNQTAMERVVSAVLPGGNPKQKSAALMMLRGDLPDFAKANARSTGPQDEPADLDPRKGNAQMLDNLARLRAGIDSGKSLFSASEIEKLSNFVTVFSQAPEIYNGENGQSVSRIPLDAIHPEHVYQTLRQAFPNKKNELLLQFAANVADFSDDNDQPTVLDSSGKIVEVAAGDTMNSSYTIGVEMTPVISEVYPDAATSVGFGDDGQFVEIHNPWTKPVSLAGWTLRTGTGGTISLNAQLPAGGYLVVTDNYDKPNPDAPTGYGSLVTLFGNTADGASRQVMVQPALELTDRGGRVTLQDQTGQLVDIFNYDSTGQVDGKLSFQRTDALVRGSTAAQATPFLPATGSAMNTEAMSIATKAWEDGNTTMTKLSQLFAISTGFVERGVADTGTNTDKVHPSQMAELQFPENHNATANSANSDPYPDNLDLRLVDIFTATRFYDDNREQLAEDVDSKARRNNQNGRSAYQAFVDKMERARERNREILNGNGTTEEETTRTTVFSYGKLNVNTCSKYALLGLDLSAGAAGTRGLPGLIEQFEGYRLRLSQTGNAPFRNVSDFITQFTPGLNRSNLEQLDTITDQVTVGSSAFEIVSTNRLSPKQQTALESKDNTNGPRPATATARWVISMDQEPYSVVSFTLVP